MIVQKHKPVGETVKPLLLIIENAIWNHEAEHSEMMPQFDNESFRAVVKIFITTIIERIWSLQESEDMSFDTRCEMAKSAAEEVRKFIKVYTDIDTMKFYEK